ncbi:SAG-related sequence [Besnoitia besnoiti]|uniref:SAG-related sequence n=1 Tax=Besnoitia besnoiti TaxID=94643 RepID=A0A2A9MMP0_BESBE|nr:SAG-related sequence [Besnoitia besnoiti]PFH36822.1 SAG-related sequence [Besnoitia besnoiti]
MVGRHLGDDGVASRAASASRQQGGSLTALSSITSRSQVCLPAQEACFMQSLHRSTHALVKPNAVASCEEKEGETLCSCAQEENAATRKAVISETSNQLHLDCKNEQSYAPDALTSSKVCAADNKDLNDCRDGDGQKCIDLNTLLSDTTKQVSWTKKQKKTANEPRVLNVPKTLFPYVDGKFVVGCLKNSSQTVCTVDVTVAARASATNEQTVACSYGEASNGKHQAVTLKPGLNSFTLVCGEKGGIQPANFKQKYCAPKEKQGDVAAECTGDYKSVLPLYEDNWWSTGETPETFVLTVPEGHFPENPTRLLVGCKYTGRKGQKGADQGEELQTTVCNVDVTIEGTGPPSSSASFSAGVAGALSVLLGACAVVV